MTETPIKSLRVHKAIEHLPQWDDDDPRFHALADDLAANGLIEPIKITTRGEIVDGRHRWRAARRMQWTTIPTTTVDDANVVTLAVSTLLARRHYTRGQLAFAAYPFFEAAHQEAKTAAVTRLRKGSASPSPIESGTGTPKTVEALASRLGVDADTFRQAAKLHGIFAKNEAIRQEWEPKIMSVDDPIGLGRAIAGIAGQEHTPKSRGTPDERVVSTALGSATKLFGLASSWRVLDTKDRTSARLELANRLATLAVNDLQAVAEAETMLKELSTLAGSVRQAAQEAMDAGHDRLDTNSQRWMDTLAGIARANLQ